MSNATIYRRVLEHFGGSPAKLASAVGANSTAAVCNWERRSIPADMAKTIEALTGISVKELRPDDWQRYWPDAAKRKVKRSTPPLIATEGAPAVPAAQEG